MTLLFRRVWAAAAVAIVFAACGKTEGGSGGNTNWFECDTDDECDAGFRCIERVCEPETTSPATGGARGALGEGSGGEAGAGTGGSSGSSDASANDAQSSVEVDAATAFDAANPSSDAGTGASDASDDASLQSDAATDASPLPDVVSDSTVSPGPDCTPLDPGICLVCTGMAVRSDTGQCGCICGEPGPLFSSGTACVNACPLCNDVTVTELGTVNAEFPSPAPPLPDGAPSCRLQGGDGVTVYRTQTCLDDRFGGTAPWTVDFGSKQVIELCDPFDGCEWQLWIDRFQDCGPLFRVDYDVLEPCVICDAPSPRCLFVEMPIAVKPIHATAERVYEDCSAALLCATTGGTWMTGPSMGCSCGPSFVFHPVSGCIPAGID